MNTYCTLTPKIKVNTKKKKKCLNEFNRNSNINRISPPIHRDHKMIVYNNNQPSNQPTKKKIKINYFTSQSHHIYINIHINAYIYFHEGSKKKEKRIQPEICVFIYMYLLINEN